MEDGKRTKDQLMNELREMRKRIVKLKAIEIVHRQMEKKLRESEKWLRNTFNSSPTATTVIDSNGSIIGCNRAALDMHGFSAEKEMLGRSSFELIAPEDRCRAAEDWKRIIEEGSVRNLEYVFLTRSGRHFPGGLSGSAIRDSSGQSESFVATSKDISLRKRMEMELRIKEEAIASSVNAIVLADLEGNLNYVNHSFLHMWGFSDRKEVMGKSIADLWESQDTALDALEAIRSNRSWVGELVGKRKDDSVFDVQILANIVENEAGKAICMMASVIDITERKKIEQMKNDFVALASHELRTPLTAIQGYTELMLDGDVGEISKEQREFLEIISQNTRRLEALINDVLDVEKIESGRMTMKMEKIDLSQIVGNCVNTFKVMAEGKGLQLEKDVKTSPINVLGDSDRLSQVFSNLLSNAIKYTKQGRVRISTGIKGKFASVAVEDTGLGMSSEDMKIVFSRFFRAEDSYVRKTTGSGLGLSIAKATIERHDGDIKVESKLGEGSRFEIILPLFKKNGGAGQ